MLWKDQRGVQKTRAPLKLLRAVVTYGSLVQLAKKIAEQEVSDLLYQILEEEKQADELLTNIPENNINEEAQEEGEE